MEIKRIFHHTHTLHIKSLINHFFYQLQDSFTHLLYEVTMNVYHTYNGTSFFFCFSHRSALFLFCFNSPFLSSFLLYIFWRKLAIHTENVDQGHENIVERKYIHSHFIYRIEFSIVLTLSCKGGNFENYSQENI